MNSLSGIYNIMSNEDKKTFIKLLSRKNKRHDVGNIDLFKSLKTDDIEKEKKYFTSKKEADAYHALRKRLYDSLLEFMANRSFEQSTGEEHEVLRLLLVSNIFFEHQLNNEAFKCLVKAEAKAIKLEQFSLLNEIYQTEIQYSYLNSKIPLETTISKYTLNKEKQYREEHLNMAYAVLRRELSEIYHAGKVTNLAQLIKKTMLQFDISIREILTYKSLYRILFIANEYASINNRYNLIETFVEKSYRFITERQDLAERHLYYHIYILYFIANIHFRNRQFEKSVKFLNLMITEMQKQHRKYHFRFAARHALMMALNENYSGREKQAAGIIQKALIENKKSTLTDLNDLRLCAIVFYIQHNDVHSSHKYMNQLIHTDNWYETKMGMDWAIKKNLIEILRHNELENTELALSRIKSFKRRYKKYLIDVKEERVIEYVLLVEKFIIKPDISTSPSFQNALRKLVLLATRPQEDIFVVSFVGWLIAKIQKKPVYKITLDLVHQRSPFHSA